MDMNKLVEGYQTNTCFGRQLSHDMTYLLFDSSQLLLGDHAEIDNE